MELIIIIAVVVLGGYLAFRHYTKDVTVDEEIVAPYKKEAPILEEAPTMQSFPTTRPEEVKVTTPAAMTAKTNAPAKPKTVKSTAKPKAPVKTKPVAKPKAPVKPKPVAKPKAPAKPKAVATTSKKV